MFTFAVMVLYLSSLNPKHFDEDVLLRLAFLVLSYFKCKTLFSIFLLFVLLLVFLCSFQGAVRVGPSNDVHTLSAHFHEHGGDKGSRTPDLLLARQALSQLSYAPIWVSGLGS